jgi:hypothetical protein
MSRNLKLGKFNPDHVGEHNPHIEIARAKKAARLSACIDRNFYMASGESPHSNADIIAKGMVDWSKSDWAALARDAGVNPPSQATVDAVRAVYETRAQFNPRPVVGPRLEVVR